MKRALLTIMMSTALLTAVPALALARHHGHHKRHHHHHARVRHDHVGSDAATPGPMGTQPSPGTTGGQQGAGTVKSFGGGVLVITLNDGSTLSGAVTNDTELKCDVADPAEVQTDEQGLNSHGGSGGGDESQGDNGRPVGNDDQGDHGDRGDNGDQGDDQGQGDDEAGSENPCTVVPGMTVQEADLTISSAGAVWNDVELVSQP